MNEALMYAKYNQAGNKSVYDILNGMSHDEREKDRGSYYGSISGLLRHVMGATCFFLGMFRTPLSGNAAAIKAIDSLPSMPPEGALNEAHWKGLLGTLEATDAAYVAFAESLNGADLLLPVKIDWYGGNPAEVPLFFLLSQLVSHNIHHRGQISQVLDSLKIDNDFSGIDAAFL